MSNKSIYDALRASGMTKEGACGIMGNMMAESGMKANIAQRGMTKLTDEQYTAAADNGLIDFVRDQVGYGLIQLTYHTRKAQYLQFARARGVSVGDEATQVQYVIQELRQDYPALWKYLCESHDLFMCAQKICVEYERPAVNNVGTRFEFAEQFFNEFANGEQKPAPEQKGKMDPVVFLLQCCMAHDGFWEMDACDGVKTDAFRAAIKEYAAAVASC